MKRMSLTLTNIKPHKHKVLKNYFSVEFDDFEYRFLFVSEMRLRMINARCDQ